MSCTKLLWMQFTCLEMLWDRYLNIKELTIRKNEQSRKRKLPHWKILKQASMEFILALKPPRMSIYLSLMTWTRKFFETWTYSPEVPTPKINPGILSFWSPRMSKHLVGSMTWTRQFFETWTYSLEVPTPKISPGILSFWSLKFLDLL